MPLSCAITPIVRPKIVLWAVDEGILQVAKYQTPDPLSYFFQKRAGSEDGADFGPDPAGVFAASESGAGR